MLLQITNRCHEGCSHCMQDSTPDGGMMDIRTFQNVLDKFPPAPATCVSGGEPTEHPQLLEFCSMLNQRGMVFTVCSNGLFTRDERKTADMHQILDMPHCFGLQIYTHQDFYKDYDYVSSLVFDHPKVIVETNPIQSMQDLGRARKCPVAQRYISSHKHYMSCLNASLAARQSSSIVGFMAHTLMPGMMCKPMIDYTGDVHLSESWLCPSVANVNRDSIDQIFAGMKRFRPCGNCSLCDRFVHDAQDSPRLQAAKQILGL